MYVVIAKASIEQGYFKCNIYVETTENAVYPIFNGIPLIFSLSENYNFQIDYWKLEKTLCKIGI